MRHMVYYTRGNIIYFEIVTKSGESCVSGSDVTTRVHAIAEVYEVNSIERID